VPVAAAAAATPPPAAADFATQRKLAALAADDAARALQASNASPVTRYVCVVEYDGSRYRGWSPSAERARELSVAGAIEMAIEPLAGPGTRVKVMGSGRTDAGVHALGQVFHVDLDRGMSRNNKAAAAAAAAGAPFVEKPAPVLSAFRFECAVNHRLEDAGHKGIRLVQVSVAPEALRPRFHARHHAASRSYLYRVWSTPAANMGSLFETERCWHVRYPLDLDRLRQALQMFLGVHDFASFQANGCTAPSSVRLVSEASVEVEPPAWHSFAGRTVGPASGAAVSARARELAGQMLSIHISSRSFLYHQVRHMVGVAVSVAAGQKGKWTLDQLADALRVDSLAASAGDVREAQRIKVLRHRVGLASAPPTGLFLHRVDYPFDLASWEARKDVALFHAVPPNDAAKLLQHHRPQQQQQQLLQQQQSEQERLMQLLNDEEPDSDDDGGLVVVAKRQNNEKGDELQMDATMTPQLQGSPSPSPSPSANAAATSAPAANP
jgi:tRNA pseudouridine38-40 synthase